MRRVSTLAGVLLAVAAAARAAEAPRPEPPADWKTRVDAVFSALDRSDSPGCALGIYRDGRLAYARGYGMANLELRVANSPETAFDIGSTAKQFAAFAILLLARDGKLAVDDDIRKYVPEIPDYGSQITIRHLLTHTSGLRDYLELMDLEGVREEDLTTDRDALDILSRQKSPNFPPGTEHLYCNSGYFLLSVIVQRVSGQSLRDFARERIFGPLGMTHTQYNDDHTRWIPNRATGYAPRTGAGFGIAMSDFEQNGDGGILTTVEDLQRWDQNFYEPVAGDRALIDQMQTPGKLNDGTALQYAFGLSVGTEGGLRMISHGGAWVGYRAQLLRFPDQHFSVACLCNLSTANPSRLAREVARVFLAAAMTGTPASAPASAGAAKPFPVSEAKLAALSGAYRDPKTGSVIRVAARNGRLVLDVDDERVPLIAVAENRFRPSDSTLDVEFRPAAGGRRQMEIREPGEAPQVLDAIEPWKPSAAELAAFAGDYTSAEIATVFRFAVANGNLVLKHRTIPPDPWAPSVRDSFTEGYRTVTFTRDAAGTVEGFRLDAGRVRDVVFRRTKV